MKHGQDARAKAGFTLIELAVTIVVAGVVGGLGATIVVEAARACTRSSAMTDNLVDANYVLSRLSAELGNLASPVDITSLSPSSISFRLGGEERTFAMLGNDLLLGTKTLASGVTAFTVTGYDAGGAVTAEPISVRRVAMEITLERNGSRASLRTEVFPRALRSSYLSWQEE